MDICQIYIITNTINDKVYIGQTWQTLQQRFYEHTTKDGCIKLINAINKHGKDNFKIELIATCDNQKSADCLETFWIKTYNSIENGYNIREGGSHGKMSEESKKKMSIAQKIRFQSPIPKETRLKMSIGQRNRIPIKHSKETKRKISEAHKKIVSRVRKPHSEETKKKMSESIKLHWFLNEKPKRVHSEETKKKMSESAKKRHSKKKVV